MDIQIEIDEQSGFCFGVTTAISKAEEVLRNEGNLYCLGDIVHNDKECDRLRLMGLKAINHNDFKQLHNVKVLLRAHGEPPETYDIARQNNIEIIDATCPVVLQLQKRIKKNWQEAKDAQIVIFGRPGHAEVLGLVGQTQGNAIVLDKPEDVVRLKMNRSIRLFSQTTKPLQEFRDIVSYIQRHIQAPATFEYFDTVCRQVANRMPNLLEFATRHDSILFVSGQKSSNGHTLYNACKTMNDHSYMVEGAADINFKWFEKTKTLGICGATSTPKWLMEACRDAILNH